MVAQVIQADYDCLEDIAAEFARHADCTVVLTFQAEQLCDRLANGGWCGLGAQAFFAEMRELVFPAMRRLQDGLQFAGDMTRRICDVMRTHEEEAARLFRGEGFAKEARKRSLEANYRPLDARSDGDDPSRPAQQQSTSPCEHILAIYHTPQVEIDNRCGDDDSAFPPFSLLSSNDTAGGTFANLHPNRRSALEYAFRWMYDQLNPAWPNFGKGDNNCTNFISQIMIASGFQQDNDWQIFWDFPKAGLSTPEEGGNCEGIPRIGADFWAWTKNSTCTRAWGITPAMKDYLIGKGFTVTTFNGYQPGETPVSQPSNHLIQPGDVVFFYSTIAAIQPNHAGLVIGWGPPVGRNGQLDFNAPLVPWIADQSGKGHPRPINDLNGAVDKVEVVHMKYPGE